jgi:flagellar assembly protein FliH
MTKPNKFLFERDFRETAQRRITEEDLVAAEENGFARGLAAGTTATENAINARIADTADKIAAQASAILADADKAKVSNEQAMVHIALTFAKALAGAAIARAPIAPIAEAAQACFAHLDGVPHLAARVNDALVDETQAVLDRIALERGFAGRMIVLGDPDIMPGDARLSWADGGLTRDAKAVEDAVMQAVAVWTADPTTKR